MEPGYLVSEDGRIICEVTYGKREKLLKVDFIAQIIIFMVIWVAGCATVAAFPDLHDGYKMLIGFLFGSAGVFASGMNKHCKGSPVIDGNL